MSTTLTPAVEQPSPTVPRRRRPSWRLLAVTLAIVAVVAHNAFQHWSDSRAREPLRLIEAAADTSGKPVGVISPERADQWDTTGGPREDVVRSVVEPGNAYLEPLFYATNQRAADPGGAQRCYFLAVQDGSVFDAEAVTSLMRICYLDPYRAPYSVFGSSVLYRD